MWFAFTASLVKARYHSRIVFTRQDWEQYRKNAVIIVRKDESTRKLFASSLFMARDGRALVPEIEKLSNVLAMGEP